MGWRTLAVLLLLISVLSEGKTTSSSSINKTSPTSTTPLPTWDDDDDLDTANDDHFFSETGILQLQLPAPPVMYDDDNTLGLLTGSAAGSPGDYDYVDADSIPGTPGQDYPLFHSCPNTGFQCPGPGFYADMEARCQAWHYCQLDARKDCFLCPNGTVFDQRLRVCNWWFNVECEKSAAFFDVNNDLYVVEGGEKGGEGRPFVRPFRPSPPSNSVSRREQQSGEVGPNDIGGGGPGGLPPFPDPFFSPPAYRLPELTPEERSPINLPLENVPPPAQPPPYSPPPQNQQFFHEEHNQHHNENNVFHQNNQQQQQPSPQKNEQYFEVTQIREPFERYTESGGGENLNNLFPPPPVDPFLKKRRQEDYGPPPVDNSENEYNPYRQQSFPDYGGVHPNSGNGERFLHPPAREAQQDQFGDPKHIDPFGVVNNPDSQKSNMQGGQENSPNHQDHYNRNNVDPFAGYPKPVHETGHFQFPPPPGENNEQIGSPKEWRPLNEPFRGYLQPLPDRGPSYIKFGEYPGGPKGDVEYKAALKAPEIKGTTTAYLTAIDPRSLIQGQYAHNFITRLQELLANAPSEEDPIPVYKEPKAKPLKEKAYKEKKKI